MSSKKQTPTFFKIGDLLDFRYSFYLKAAALKYISLNSRTSFQAYRVFQTVCRRHRILHFPYGSSIRILLKRRCQAAGKTVLTGILSCQIHHMVIQMYR